MEKSINKMSAISGNESKITPVFLMDEVKKSTRELRWKNVAKEMGLSFVLLYLDKINSSEVICAELEVSNLSDKETEMQLARLLPYQEDARKKGFTRLAQPDLVISSGKLMDFIKYFNEGHLSEEKFVIIFDNNLVNSQVKDLVSGETLSITRKESSLAFELSHKLNVPPKLQEIKIEVNKSSSGKIADISVEEFGDILKVLLDEKSNKNDTFEPNSEQELKEEKTNVAGTDFYYSEFAVYYKDDVLYKQGTAKYNLFVILAEEQKPIDRVKIAEKLKIRGTNYKPTSIGALVAKINKDIRSITNKMHREFIKNIQKTRSNKDFGYYLNT